jgi:aerobic-type carbon monoxide dehydrogenase small subunit (CoxS/CutS family)
MRRVALQIDGAQRDVVVDVRESLWETMTNKLGVASSNLGCDRAQCGACTVLVDGRAVNGCTVLTARLGRGQNILTVNGLTQGPGPEGLHPVQRAFWLEGGFQCGICTRGFIMSSYALLQTTKSPTDEQIAEALGGNICRCGEYTKIYKAVHVAAADMRGEQVTYTAPPIVVTVAKPAAAGAAGGRTSKEFVFTTAFSTIEEFEPFANKVKEKGAGAILEASGSERTITLTWDPGKLDENAIRQLLAQTGKTVNP